MQPTSSFLRTARRLVAIVSVVFGGIFLCFVSSFGAERVSLDELAKALEGKASETEFVVRDGEYKDLKLKLEVSGKEDARVQIRAETPGGVVISGESCLLLKGEYVTVEGFLFREGHSPIEGVIEFEGSHCRLTNCAIDAFNHPDPKRKDKWVSLKGQHHEVDHCTFRGKASFSVLLTVWHAPGVPNHIHIHHNHFVDRAQIKGKNGYETIRIGTSEVAHSDSITLVEENLFERCDGEIETISCKSGANIFRRNTFRECAGTLTLRHGNGSLVEENYFDGGGKKETGGVRVYGENHIIRGNYITRTTGRADGAIAFMAGNPKPEPHEWQQVRNVSLENNIVALNRGPALKYDENYGEDNRVVLPEGLRFVGNTFVIGKEGTFSEGSKQDTVSQWENNAILEMDELPEDLKEKLPKAMTVKEAGASWFENQ